MLVWGVTPEQIKACVITASNSGYQGNVVTDGEPVRTGVTDRSAVSFRLRVLDSKEAGHRLGFVRTSRGNRRRLVAACWHAHRDVMGQIFDRYPNARIKTMLFDYRGAEDFVRNFRHTGDRNAGSLFEPVALRDLCECEHEEVRV
jgi:hypothetical protein